MRQSNRFYIMNNKIAILDAGSQFVKLIDCCVRKLGYLADIFPLRTNYNILKEYNGIIISGGPDSVYLENSIKCDPELFNNNTPIFGICYGMQLINHMCGGVVGKMVLREDGQVNVSIEKSNLFANIESPTKVLMTHGDNITKLAPNFVITGENDKGITSIEHTSKPYYGVQFHPEVNTSIDGLKMFQNFADICCVEKQFDLQNLTNQLAQQIKITVGDKTVIAFVSGGVDSSVCLALLHKSIPKSQIKAVHVNTGFLREKEIETIKYLQKEYDVNVLDCAHNYYNILKNVREPEEKRQLIGNEFVNILNDYLKNHNIENYLLMQGTLRPDLIESSSKEITQKADKIKTHHNDSELIRQMRDKGLVIEPLKDFHKHEVRELGALLGLPIELINRQPFPGPGLAIRIINNITNRKIINGDGCIILPLKTVGIQGDCRTYKNIGVITKYDLQKAKNVIHKNDINRCLYLLSGDINDLKISDCMLDKYHVELLRNIDNDLNKILEIKEISQVPIILLPISDGTGLKYSISIRPIVTDDFMTAIPYVLSEEILDSILDVLDKYELISHVFIDMTEKPPGTIEYE